jgi:hypothetical protein
MSVKKRFLEHLESKGAIPKGFCNGYAEGGMVHDDDEWKDDDWNDHDDDSGEPETFGSNYMQEYAFGGEVKAKRHAEPMESLHGKDYGRPNYQGPGEEEQADQDMSEEEIRHHMVRAIKARKMRR